MVLKLYGTHRDLIKNDFEYEIRDCKTGENVATATFFSTDWCKMYYQNVCYLFNTYPKIVRKSNLHTPYPTSSKMKKTFGFRILQDNTIVGHYYGDALRCSGTEKPKRNIGITVFECFGATYILYHVGIPNEFGHYYCLVDNYGRTVGIIERYTAKKDNSKATIYVEDYEHLRIVLLACVEEIVLVNAGNGMDRSAAKYISRWEEEQRLLNKDFLHRVKANSGIFD